MRANLFCAPASLAPARDVNALCRKLSHAAPGKTTFAGTGASCGRAPNGAAALQQAAIRQHSVGGSIRLIGGAFVSRNEFAAAAQRSGAASSPSAVAVAVAFVFSETLRRRKVFRDGRCVQKGHLLAKCGGEGSISGAETMRRRQRPAFNEKRLPFSGAKL